MKYVNLMLYIINIYSVMCQLYHNKTGREKKQSLFYQKKKGRREGREREGREGGRERKKERKKERERKKKKGGRKKGGEEERKRQICLVFLLFLAQSS